MFKFFNAFIFILVFANIANSQQNMSSEDIVSHFLAETLGKERGLCISVNGNCETVEPPKGLDMTITFEHDSAELTLDAVRNLVKFAIALQDERLATTSFLVEGHTDASGGEEYNKSLGLKRAEAVSEFLVTSGVAPSRIKALGLGEERPRSGDPNDPINRRVEMHLSLN